MRIAYIVSAGTAALLAGTSLRIQAGSLKLRVPDHLVLTTDSIPRRLDRLAGLLGVSSAVTGNKAG